MNRRYKFYLLIFEIVADRKFVRHLSNFHYENINQTLYVSIEIKISVAIGFRYPVQIKTVYFFTAFFLAIRPKVPPIHFVTGARSQRQKYHGVNLVFPLHLCRYSTKFKDTVTFNLHLRLLL
jgi:hypothetical protein